MSSQNTPADVRAEVFETRIALSFFGGVSLAVYESGMAVEFFRLVTRRRHLPETARANRTG